jgi:hypothetical protein
LLRFASCLIAPAAGLPLISCGRDDFADVSTQREILDSYVSEANCDNAQFDLLEREDAVQDWRYVVRISGSSECLTSLREALVSRDARPSDMARVTGVLLPGYDDPKGEVVGFHFARDAESVVWTRDKI